MSETTTTLGTDLPKGCGCPFCMNGGSRDPILNDNDEPAGDQTGAPTTYATPQQMADQLVNGYWNYAGWSYHNWGTNSPTVTFSLSNEFSSAEKSSIRMAFSLWSQVANISFSEVSSGAQITFLEGDDGGAWSGNTYWNPATHTMTSNTISVDTDTYSWGDLTTIGGYGVQTLIHEIGHSLGLGHAGNYNGNVNYDTQVQYLNDNRQYTVMSYNNANLLGTDHWNASGAWQYGSTPLLYDIMAIQQIYGANTTTRTGDTVYGFNSNTGLTQFNFSLTTGPVVAIWDAGGTDTLDLSGYSTNQTISLIAGEFSSVGSMTNNLVIAFNTVIENAVGGSGADTIYTNTANNSIWGGNGNDRIYGSTGNDTIDGQGGADTFSYTYAASAFSFNFIDSVTVSVQHLAQGFTGLLKNIETFIFASASYTFAELEALFGVEPSLINLRFTHADGSYGYNSSDSETKVLSTASIDRTNNDMTITVSGTSNSNLRITGDEYDDSITVTGTDAALDIRFNGGDGDDEITINSGIVGNDTLYGEGGDDTIRAGAGNDVLFGQAGADILYGGDGDDSLKGGTENDTLYGDAGTDYVDGEAGDDVIHGGAGDDMNIVVNGVRTAVGGLYGGLGNDTIYGDAGNDRLQGGDGNDTLYGGDDNDQLYGDAGNDVLRGESGNDSAFGGLGNDTIYGGAGDDRLLGDDGDDRVEGGAGVDTVEGGNGADQLYGDDGNDTLKGGEGGDSLFGGNDNDILFGGNGVDYLYGAAGNDIVRGDDGNDYAYGGDGSDDLRGGLGNDTIYGDAGIDYIEGNDGDDVIYGGAGDETTTVIAGVRYAGGIYGGNGNDRIYGEAGNDRLYGDAGNDILVGGAGIDRMNGGAGSDIFALGVLDGSVDKIEDFTYGGGSGDKINITEVLIGYDASDDIDNFVRLIYRSNTRSDLVINADGIGNDGVLVAQIVGSDFNGVSVETLLGNGTLVANQSVV